MKITDLSTSLESTINELKSRLAQYQIGPETTLHESLLHESLVYLKQSRENRRCQREMLLLVYYPVFEAHNSVMRELHY